MNKKSQAEIYSIFLIGFFIIGLYFLLSLSLIPFNEYAVYKTFSGNLNNDILEKGFHYVGMFSHVYKINNQIRNHQITIEGSSKDLQKVTILLNVNMQIRRDKIYDFVKNYADEDIYTDYLNNKMQENIKIDILKYNVLDFINNRSEVSNDIKYDVQNINELNYFDIKDISIVNIKYSDEIESVLEQKGQVLLQKEIIMRQKENILLINQNMNLVNMSDYFKYIISEKWNGNTPLTIIGNN